MTRAFSDPLIRGAKLDCNRRTWVKTVGGGKAFAPGSHSHRSGYLAGPKDVLSEGLSFTASGVSRCSLTTGYKSLTSRPVRVD